MPLAGSPLVESEEEKWAGLLASPGPLRCRSKADQREREGVPLPVLFGHLLVFPGLGLALGQGCSLLA